MKRLLSLAAGLLSAGTALAQHWAPTPRVRIEMAKHAEGVKFSGAKVDQAGTRFVTVSLHGTPLRESVFFSRPPR